MRQRKKNTEKDLFLYKGNFIPCLCTVLSLFFCELSYMLWKSLFDEAKGNLLVENLRWEEFGLGTLVSVAFVLPFSTCRCEMGMSSFHYYLSIFKRRLNFVSCSLWVVLMFYLSWTEKKKLLKKTSSDCCRLILWNVAKALVLTTRYHETYKNCFY